eukprot:scaffold459834_cov18-Prasinocladus_malaysianus.AAC.1
MQQLELIFKLLAHVGNFKVPIYFTSAIEERHLSSVPNVFGNSTVTVCVKSRKPVITLAKPAAGTGRVLIRSCWSPSTRIWPGLRDMPLWSKVESRHSPIKSDLETSRQSYDEVQLKMKSTQDINLRCFR